MFFVPCGLHQVFLVEEIEKLRIALNPPLQRVLGAVGLSRVATDFTFWAAGVIISHIHSSLAHLTLVADASLVKAQ